VTEGTPETTSLKSLLRRPLLWAAAFSCLVNMLLLVPALFMMQVFDRVLSSGSGETLAVLVIGTGVALLLMFALDHLRSRLQGVSGQLLGDAITPLVTRLALASRARPGAPAQVEAVRDVARVRALFSSQGLIALFDAPWLLVYVGVIALAHWALGAMALGAAVLMLTLAIVNDRITRRGIESVQQQAGQTARVLEGGLANAEVVQTLGLADAVLARWGRLNHELVTMQQATARRTVALAALARLLRQSVQVAMLSLGAWLVITQRSTPGAMVACTILLGRALAPVELLVGSWKVLAEARAAWGRLTGLLGQGEAAHERMSLPPPQGALETQGVVWRAPGDGRIILGGVSFALAPGESLAVVGPSGAGKSTLMRVVTGLWAPAAGAVRLDGVDVAKWPRGELGPHLGYMPQTVDLFAGTVAENIARLGSVDSEKVVEAARQAHLHEMILALPGGYDTLVDPHGTLLSPGQRQRIALARALYGQPRLLVLDEPNSNLDGAGEQALAQTLATLRGKATVIVVTHRTTLTQHADKMLVLEGGRVLHFGPTAEVLQAMQGQRAPGQVLNLPRGALPGRAPAAGGGAGSGVVPGAGGDK
jgi:PrtD family type I secretion system ABC transporter